MREPEPPPHTHTHTRTHRTLFARTYTYTLRKRIPFCPTCTPYHTIPFTAHAHVTMYWEFIGCNKVFVKVWLCYYVMICIINNIIVCIIRKMLYNDYFFVERMNIRYDTIPASSTCSVMHIRKQKPHIKMLWKDTISFWAILSEIQNWNYPTRYYCCF